MRARRGAAFTLVILALALGASACGGGSPKTATMTPAQQAATHEWRVGLVQWQRSMFGALNGISVVFSTSAGLVELQSNGTTTFKKLLGYEHALATCTTTVGGLGPAPVGLLQARIYALKACTNLERGEKFVEAAVREVRASSPSLDALDAAIGPLSTGESELKAASFALKAVSDSST